MAQIRNVERKALLLSLCIAVALTVLLMFYLQKKSLDTGPLVKVVVAAQNIEARTVISDIHLREIMIPQKYAVSGNVARKADLVGKIAKDKIFAGEQVIGERIITGRENGGLAAVVKPGYRAVTIKVDQVSGVGGYVRTGDFVDIFVFLQPPYSKQEIVKAVFQRVEVLDSGTTANTSDERYLTIIMTPSDAKRLFLCTELSKVRLALRNTVEKSIFL